MKQPLLIADSGGTKTDWCFVDELGNKDYFTSESYHPSNWTSEFIEQISIFWEQRAQLKEAQLHFFCAGCLNPEKAKQLELIFHSLGFKDVTVKSDLHAAGLALFGNRQGTFAILGTGSVLVDWNAGEVVSVFGGKGHVQGDEGSGFYFGKLVYEAYLKRELSIDQERILEKEVDLNLLAEKYKRGDTKYVLAELANTLKNEQHQFLDFHIKNIRAFYDSVLEQRVPIDLQVVGGYFFYNSAILKPIFHDLKVHVTDFQHRPIYALVDYMIASVE